MKGLVISCTVALEANSSPTLTFSLSSLLVDPGHSEEFAGSSAAGGVGTSSVDLAVAVVVVVALEPEDLTVLSYKDTMLWKAAGGLCCDRVLFCSTASVGSSRLYR